MAVLVICFVAAASAGYWVASRLGTDALRIEAEKQLADLMYGDVRIGTSRIVLRGGLFIEGERVSVYSRSTRAHDASLFVERVSAELDVFALITGRFGLSSLLLEDAVFEIERKSEGQWAPYPIQALDARRRRVLPDDIERNLDLSNAFETVTRVLLERPLVARHFELRRGRVSFVDAERPGPDGEPSILSLMGLNGRLVHHWLSQDAELQLSGVLIGAAEGPVPVRAEGRGRGGEALRLAVAVDRLPLSLFDRARDDDRLALAGSLGGELSYDTRATGHGTLALHCTIEQLTANLRVLEGYFEIERPLVELDAALELHPGRVRLVNAKLDARGIDFELMGTLERPLRLSSRMRVEASIQGLELDEVRELARSLPGEDGRNLLQLMSRISSGRFERIGGVAAARLGEWRELVSGERESLPSGFLLRADLADVRADSDGGAGLSELSGQLEISGDRVAFRDARALWKSEPLPRLNLAIDGFSQLIRAGEREIDPSTSASSLPGLDPLWRLLRSEPGEPQAQQATATHIVMTIDALEHPVLRWPIVDAQVEVETTAEGLHFAIARALWAGVPLRGEASWLAGDEETLTIELRLSQPESPARQAVPAPALAAPAEGALPRWAAGRFELRSTLGEQLPLRGLKGSFGLTENTLDLAGLEADVLPRGRLAATLELDLGDPLQLPIALRFSLDDGDVAHMGEALGLPPGFATGRVRLTGQLEGALRPQTPLLSGLRGAVALDARDGEIRRELPVAGALANASEAYNSYARRESIVYEAATGLLRFTDGRIATDDLQIEGPVRVYANGWLDATGPPYDLSAVVGVFLFRGAGRFMETVPLFKVILPGSERGLVGAYYRVSGGLGDPIVESLPGMSMAEDLPDVLGAPFKVLQALLSGQTRQSANEPARSAQD